jgi:hypothetical protein
MTASTYVDVTNLTPGSECNRTSGLCVSRSSSGCGSTFSPLLRVALTPGCQIVYMGNILAVIIECVDCKMM